MSMQTAKLLEELKARLARMTAKAQRVVEQATESMLKFDPALAQESIRADALVDADEIEIERAAIELLAQHQPVAADLRFVTSVIKVNGDFERIGDCAVNIAQRVPYLAQKRNMGLPQDVRVLAEQVLTNLREVISAFKLVSIEAAEKVLAADDVVDALYHQVVHDMLEQIERQPDSAGRDLALVMIAKNYERIGDHCSNIASDIIYMKSGRIVRHVRQAEDKSNS